MNPMRLGLRNLTGFMHWSLQLCGLIVTVTAFQDRSLLTCTNTQPLQLHRQTVAPVFRFLVHNVSVWGAEN